MIRLTFDNSVRINAFQNPADYSGDPAMRTRVVAATKLRKLSESNPELIEITCNGGERFEQGEGKEKFLVTRGAWLLGDDESPEFDSFSELGVSTYLSSDLSEEISRIVHPGSSKVSKDCAVLCEHAAAGRDIFVSEDKPRHLKKAPQLKELGIIVKSAPETVTYLEEQYGIDFGNIREAR